MKEKLFNITDGESGGYVKITYIKGKLEKEYVEYMKKELIVQKGG